MRQTFLILLAFTLGSMPIAFAQGSDGTGVWTSPGYGMQDSRNGEDTGNTNSHQVPAASNRTTSASAPVVNTIDVVYDNVEKVEILQITGANFSPYKEKIRITVSGAQASVLRSDPKLITAVLPPDSGSPGMVSVAVNGQTVLKDKKIKLPPRVTGVSLLSGPPGTPITIYGARFARKLTDNQVFIGGIEVPVNGGSRTELSVEVPAALDMQSPVWGVPIMVKVGKLSSNNDVSIRIQNRVY
jgi:hypothetical protein